MRVPSVRTVTDEGTWIAIIIGVILGLFYIIASSRKGRRHPISRSERRRAEDEEQEAEDELDDWDQQDQLEGDEV